MTHGNFLVNILCQCPMTLVPMRRWATELCVSYAFRKIFLCQCRRVCYADVETHWWEKWKSRYTSSFTHHLCADAGMSANMLCRSGDMLVAKMEKVQN